ncbi:glycoside hydrolase family 43 protein [Paenibacillus silviterrae]|uniref:glycoside hydrolase family 43 protein n=1 Tax=Paenibacillus silviterrae TaxID=3242194 RepID=UPI0025432498|nr:glycoside hydrolase family 43 protein [Paenibacillus chinjuensis]
MSRETNERTYANPILSGFHPDPSIVRVGDDYYMVNSTFQYFPAILISHSKDLVHWEYIGHGITNSEDIPLAGLPDSFGIWAPDISYYNGTFYIFATLRNTTESGRVNIMMKSSCPEGPYSKPVVINHKGLDPSHFVDDDGTHYMVYGSSGATLLRLNDECTEAIGEPVTVWKGTGRVSPEGPHVLKKDGYYYIVQAEGGTEYGHCVTMARSKDLFGPYEECPHNPVHTQSDRSAAIQRAGHGKLVQTQNGDWWMVYLAGRPLGGGYCVLGRETCLDPVHWTEDGWISVNEGRGPSDVQTAPALVQAVYKEPATDDFDADRLPVHWQFVRNPDSEHWSLAERPGHVRIWTGDEPLESIEVRNVLVRRERHHHYTAALKLDFTPKRDGEQAGLTCYYDSRCFLQLALTYADGIRLRLTENRARTLSCLSDIPLETAGVIYLKVEVDKERRAFYYSRNGKDWSLAGVVPDALFLSDEGTQEKKAFTGTMVGFYANSGGSGRRIAADFDWFHYEGRNVSIG